VLIAAFSLFLPWFQVLLAPLRAKYAYLSALSDPEPYREAVRADELWLITLMMSAIGLLTAIKWQSVFPDLRDNRSLATLPMRAYQIFLAKLLALLIVATAVIPTLNFLPSVLFPALSESRWSVNLFLGRRVLVHAATCMAGSYFFFFALIAFEGILLLTLRPLFSNIAGYVQGILVSSMLVLVVGSFAIEPTITNTALHPSWARWLPPIWFLGLYQNMLGDPDPQMQVLAHWALIALLTSIFLTIITYFFAYQRHLTNVEQGARKKTKRRPKEFSLLYFFVSKPRQAAVICFMSRTLAASSQHRTILMGYLGFGAAILVSGVLGIRTLVQPTRLIAARFVYAHVVMLIFLLIGFRHLFSIPAELRANWIFRVTEQEGRKEWLAAIDRFVLFAGGTAVFLMPFPFEFRLLGWRALAESTLLGIFGLLCFECVFYSWEKLPFTCSHLPGKFPIWIRALQLFGLFGLLTPVNAILLGCLYSLPVFVTLLILLLVTWTLVHRNRVRAHEEIRLKYEESPEPAVVSLSLLK